jgi:hypothetical protein
VAAAPAAAAAAPAPAPLVGAQYAGLAQLVGLFEPAVLAERTALLDMRGTRLREGATIMFSAHPSGALMVQGGSSVLMRARVCAARGLWPPRTHVGMHTRNRGSCAALTPALPP